MPHIIKDDGEYLLVSHTDKTTHRGRLQGGPRNNFMVTYADSTYHTAKGRMKHYAYPQINVGQLHIHCPKELASKRVRIKVEVIKLPKRGGKR